MFIFQQWLIQQRLQKNLTIDQLAQQLGQPTSFIQKVENGQYKLDVIEYLNYCKALGIDPNQGIAIIQTEFDKNRKRLF